MSDIPVGSPEPPPGRHAAPGGWYPDPVDPARERWWDGWQWSRDTREGSGRAAAARTDARPGPGTVGGAAPQTEDGVPLAGWWWRALAICLDGLMLGVISTLLSLPFLATVLDTLTRYVEDTVEAARQGLPPPPEPVATDFFSPTELLALTAVSALCGFAWHALFLRLRSATPGKMIAGLRVVPLGRGLSSGGLSWRAALLRSLVWTLPALHNLLLVLRAVDIVLPLTNPRKQALHDLVAGTQVVRVR